jgi:hypothetical protein
MLINEPRYRIALLLLFTVCLLPNAARAQEGTDKLIVHIRSAAVTLNHVSLKNEALAREVAATLEKVDGVTRTRALPLSAMVEATFDTKKTTGEQVANAAKKVLEEKLTGKRIDARNLPSGDASSKIFVKSLADNRLQITSERFY